MMSIEAPWFYTIIGVLELFSCLNVKIIIFVVYLIVFSPLYKSEKYR
jgi:hypothetical protein